MANRYEVTTFDVCVQGFERLRSQSEFIVIASINADSTAEEIATQWADCIQSCDMGDGFDYDAARQTIADYVGQTVRPLFSARRNPFNLEEGRTDIGIMDSESECIAFLYITDTTQ